MEKLLHHMSRQFTFFSYNWRNTMKKQNKKELILKHIKSLSILCFEDNKTNQVLYDSTLKDLVDNVIYVDDEYGY